MFVNGYPYTDFRAVNSKDGRFRLQDGAYGVRFEVDSATLTADSKIYVPNAGGSMVVRGYHMTYGSATFQRDPNIAADTLYTGTATITGMLSTSIVFVNFAGLLGSGAATGPLPIGVNYKAAGIANLMLLNLAATTTIGTSIVNYVMLLPQTS